MPENVDAQGEMRGILSRMFRYMPTAPSSLPMAWWQAAILLHSSGVLYSGCPCSFSNSLKACRIRAAAQKVQLCNEICMDVPEPSILGCFGIACSLNKEPVVESSPVHALRVLPAGPRYPCRDQHTRSDSPHAARQTCPMQWTRRPSASRTCQPSPAQLCNLLAALIGSIHL